jgi:hypothetical protein
MAGRPGYIFILSHMRSYSTLLAHLLGSHPEISGYAERSISYRSPLRLYGLRLRLALSRKLEGARYVLDKILHDGYAISRSVLRQGNVVPIILVRRPEPTLASIFGLGALAGAHPWYTDPEAVTRYYARRLARLAEYGSWAPDRAILVRSEDMLQETQLVLTRLTQELDLDAPLSTTYRLFEHTGKPGYGDPSQRILAGQVIAAKRDRHLPGAISAAQRRRAQIAYATCLSRLAHDARDLSPTLPSAVASGVWDRG